MWYIFNVLDEIFRMAQSTYLSTNFCMTGLEKSAGCNCPYFLNVAADTQLLPVSPKCVHTPEVSSLYSCLFRMGFT